MSVRLSGFTCFLEVSMQTCKRTLRFGSLEAVLQAHSTVGNRHTRDTHTHVRTHCNAEHD